jgi:hypothetical protein
VGDSVSPVVILCSGMDDRPESELIPSESSPKQGIPKVKELGKL